MRFLGSSRRGRRLLGSFGLALALTTSAAAPGATAAHEPSLRPEAPRVGAGERYAVVGSGWSVSPTCSRRVQVSRRLGHGVRLGSAPIAADGSFVFSRLVPRAADRGTRIVLDATQFCRKRPQAAPVGVTVTVLIRVGRPGRACPEPLSVEGVAYLVKVWGGVSCERGFAAIGAFIGSGDEVPGFRCAAVDPRTGHDAACLRSGANAGRVTARRLREV